MLQPSTKIGCMTLESLWYPITVNSVSRTLSIPHRCHIHFCMLKLGISAPMTPDLSALPIMPLSPNFSALCSQSTNAKSFSCTKLGRSSGIVTFALSVQPTKNNSNIHKNTTRFITSPFLMKRLL
ncbi:hypothetical protein D3C79_932990 [compost metagenome]